LNFWHGFGFIKADSISNKQNTPMEVLLIIFALGCILAVGSFDYRSIFGK